MELFVLKKLLVKNLWIRYNGTMPTEHSYHWFNAVIFLSSLIFLALPPLFVYEKKTPAEIFAALPIYQVTFRILFAAAYEELLYRVYLPYASKSFFTGAFSWKAQSAGKIAEISTLLLFAFAHRYLGTGAVLYAAAAHAILRGIFCKVKRKPLALFVVFFLHSANNFVVYFFL